MSNARAATVMAGHHNSNKRSKNKTTLWVYRCLLLLLLGWCAFTWLSSVSVWSSSSSNNYGQNEIVQRYSFQKIPRRATTTTTSHQKGQSSTSPAIQNLITYLSNGEKSTVTAKELEQLKELFSAEIAKVQDVLQRTHQQPFLPLTAYLEAPLPPYNSTRIPRLPSRLNNQPKDLIQREFGTPHFQTCWNLPNAFPIMKPTTHTSNNDHSNIEDQHANDDCPVHADPFLPWIHDVFVSTSGKVVEILAHNLRRCHTNPKDYLERLEHLEPQLTLMQSVPVVREVLDMAVNSINPPTYRYRLASLSEAEKVAQHRPQDAATETRFICHFHTRLLVDDNGEAALQTISLGETLSVFPYNYEHANYQKRNSKPLLTRPTNGIQDDKNTIHNEQVWNSLLHFQCPIPTHLQPLLLDNNDKDNDKNNGGGGGIYVDVIPIRTYPRLNRGGYFNRNARNMSNDKDDDDLPFDPHLEWGLDAGDDNNNQKTKHWLPLIEQSGRWTNIPLCTIPATEPTSTSSQTAVVAQPSEGVVEQRRAKVDPLPPTDNGKTKHFMTACVWASATFTTRGSSDADTSTSERLLEWLTYQLQIAEFDHVYIYDNTPAVDDSGASLEPVTRLFSRHQVTRIPWKHPVCNNNRPGNPDPGERSSQYAAEASCRIRYGPMTKWMAVLDTDEYLIPQPPHKSLREWLQQTSIDNPATKIWSFYQTRAIPNRDIMDPLPSDQDPQYQWQKRADTTYLETYNCDRLQFPKPGWAWRAQKQIFQPSFVLLHFVHYSLVTRRLLDTPSVWSGMYKESPPYERRLDEQRHAFLLHTKTTSPKATQYWRKQCYLKQRKKDKSNECPVGIPFPPGVKEGSADHEGLEYNCYPHEVVTQDVAPKLKKLMHPLIQKYRQSRENS